MKAKSYVLILLFTKDCKKTLLVKRYHPPYQNCYNAIGGKIEEGESALAAALRETKEEVGATLESLELLYTIIYPNQETLTIYYQFVEEFPIVPEASGEFSWMDIEFALDCNNTQLAGLGNLAMFCREALIYSGRKQTDFTVE